MRARLLALSLPVLLAACGVPFTLSVRDFNLPVSQASLNNICYVEVSDQAQPHVAKVALSGMAGYTTTNSAPSDLSVSFQFYARVSAPAGGQVVTANGQSLTCVSPSPADEPVGNVSVKTHQTGQPYTLSGPGLDAGVQAGTYWLGVNLSNSAALPNLLNQDYGAVDFTKNHVTFSFQ